jgi:cation:H+ antiporter
MSMVILCAGMALLLAGGDILVRGSVGIAVRNGIAPVVIGLTIVAMGTSAPELFVSAGSAYNGAGGIAIGNVVGSNIANVLLVLALPSLFIATSANVDGIGRNIVMMLTATIVAMVLMYQGVIGRPAGVLLLGLFIAYLADQLRSARSGAVAFTESKTGAKPIGTWTALALIAGGLVLLPVGAQLTVDSATAIARAMGVSETLIGLTIVAIGTSLPELAASMLAVLRGTNSVALGNVVGSNVFNIAGILGVSAITRPMDVPERVLSLDIWVMLAAALFLGFMAWQKRELGRMTAVAMLACYAAYIALSLYL